MRGPLFWLVTVPIFAVMLTLALRAIIRGSVDTPLFSRVRPKPLPPLKPFGPPQSRPEAQPPHPEPRPYDHPERVARRAEIAADLTARALARQREREAAP